MHRIATSLLALFVGCSPERPHGVEPAPPAPAPQTPASGASAPEGWGREPRAEEPRELPGVADVREIEGMMFVVQTLGGARADERLPLVVAMHGLGDTPESFVGLFDGMELRARVASARAPDPYRGGGFAWLPVPRDEHDLRPALRRAVQMLERAMPGLTAAYPTCGAPIAVGFSQGGMVAFALAASARPAFAGVVPVSGLMPADMVPRTAPEGAPHVRALHGDADAVVPVGPARSAVAAFRRAGYDVQMREHPGVGHTITQAMHRDIEARLRTLAPACEP